MVNPAPSELLAYPIAGCVTMYHGRDWFSGHEVCPFCNSQLTDLGAFHGNQHNLVKANDPEYGPMLCTRCFNRASHPDLSVPPIKDKNGREYYRPKDVTPGAGACLFAVKICRQCGWWYVVEDADVCNNGSAAVYSGILQTFDPTSAAIPLEVLRQELPKNLDRIDRVHPRKMQELVADILAGAYDCEVHQLAYTRDGGVDLILLMADTHIAVQVKRRENYKKSEAVKGVREFLGAAQLAGYNDLIYVTNARSFSPDAEAAAQKAVTKNLVRQFELISRRRLRELLQQYDTPESYWADALRKSVAAGCKMPDIPDPFTLSGAD